MIVHGYRAGVSASPPTVEELTALRADNERLSAEREHYRELYLRMLETNIYRRASLAPGAASLAAANAA